MNEGIYTIIDADTLVYLVAYKFRDSDNTEAALQELDKFVRTLLDNTAASYYAGFIGGEKCFRYEVAKTKPYKGNRPLSPDWYVKWSGPMKAFLRDEWNFQVVNSIEADDAVTIYQTYCLENGLNSVMCHGDKDIYQQEGNHYDIRKHTRLYVDSITAGRNLYKQILIGDSSDNIVGLKGCGKVKTAKLLDNENDIYRMSQIVKFAFMGEDFEKYYSGDVTRIINPIPDKEGYKLFKENYSLIYLLRHSDNLPVVWNTYTPKPLSEEPEIDLTGLIWD